MITINWDIFQAKFIGRDAQDKMELLSYFLFCKECNQEFGIFGYINQAGIEKEPINIGDKKIGFQSKFYTDNLKKYKSKIKDSIKKSKDRYKITDYYFYCNKDFTDPKNGNIKNKEQKDIEDYAKNMGVKITWRLNSYFENLPSNKNNEYLLEYFFENNEKSLLSLISNFKKESKEEINYYCYELQNYEFKSNIKLINNIQKLNKETIIIESEPKVGKHLLISQIKKKENRMCLYNLPKKNKLNKKINIDNQNLKFEEKYNKNNYFYINFIKFEENKQTALNKIIDNYTIEEFIKLSSKSENNNLIINFSGYMGNTTKHKNIKNIIKKLKENNWKIYILKDCNVYIDNIIDNKYKEFKLNKISDEDIKVCLKNKKTLTNLEHLKDLQILGLFSKYNYEFENLEEFFNIIETKIFSNKKEILKYKELLEKIYLKEDFNIEEYRILEEKNVIFIKKNKVYFENKLYENIVLKKIIIEKIKEENIEDVLKLLKNIESYLIFTDLLKDEDFEVDKDFLIDIIKENISERYTYSILKYRLINNLDYITYYLEENKYNLLNILLSYTEAIHEELNLDKIIIYIKNNEKKLENLNKKNNEILRKIIIEIQNKKNKEELFDFCLELYKKAQYSCDYIDLLNFNENLNEVSIKNIICYLKLNEKNIELLLIKFLNNFYKINKNLQKKFYKEYFLLLKKYIFLLGEKKNKMGENEDINNFLFKREIIFENLYKIKEINEEDTLLFVIEMINLASENYFLNNSKSCFKIKIEEHIIYHSSFLWCLNNKNDYWENNYNTEYLLFFLNKYLEEKLKEDKNKLENLFFILLNKINSSVILSLFSNFIVLNKENTFDYEDIILKEMLFIKDDKKKSFNHLKIENLKKYFNDKMMKNYENYEKYIKIIENYEKPENMPKEDFEELIKEIKPQIITEKEYLKIKKEENENLKKVNTYLLIGEIKNSLEKEKEGDYYNLELIKSITNSNNIESYVNYEYVYIYLIKYDETLTKRELSCYKNKLLEFINKKNYSYEKEFVKEIFSIFNNLEIEENQIKLLSTLKESDFRTISLHVFNKIKNKNKLINIIKNKEYWEYFEIKFLILNNEVDEILKLKKIENFFYRSYNKHLKEEIFFDILELVVSVNNVDDNVIEDYIKNILKLVKKDCFNTVCRLINLNIKIEEKKRILELTSNYDFLIGMENIAEEDIYFLLNNNIFEIIKKRINEILEVKNKNNFQLIFAFLIKILKLNKEKEIGNHYINTKIKYIIKNIEMDKNYYFDYLKLKNKKPEIEEICREKFL